MIAYEIEFRVLKEDKKAENRKALDEVQKCVTTDTRGKNAR